MARCIALLTLLVLLSVASAPAFAQSPEKEAQALFEEGGALYFKQEYGGAIVKFKTAHIKSPNALFLYNISLCHLKLGQFGDALSAAREAREMGGLDEQTSTKNDSRIVSLQRVLLAHRAAEAVGVQQASEDADTGDLVAGDPEATTTSGAAAKGGGFGALGWVGVASTVLGVGLLTGSLVTELGLQGKWEDFRQAGEDGDEVAYARLKGEIEDGQQIGAVLLYSGAAITAVGLTLIIIELASGDSASATLQIVPTSGGATVGYTQRF